MSNFVPVTRAQVVDLKARLWPEYCRARGWGAKDRALQMHTLSEILGRRIESSTEIGKLEEFTKVKTELQAWAHPADLNRTVRNLDNPNRNLRWKIMNVQAAQLAVVFSGRAGAAVPPHATADQQVGPTSNHLERQLAAEQYIAKVMRDKFGTDDLQEVSEVVTRGRHSDLEKLVFTIEARINALRNERGLSIHQMNQLAGIACGKSCGQCKNGFNAKAQRREEVMAA